ncbi:MAG: hypothetical protein JWQ30_435 [Sediminibacterium sp.]|nr:hypothetical protein [Sediminibacterium sp.]
MYRFRFSKKTWLLAFCFSAGITVTAQTHTFRFFPIKDLPLIYQGFLGRIGSRFYLMNRTRMSGLEIYIYDTLSQKGNAHTYPIPGQLVSVSFHERSLSFISIATAEEGKRSCYFLELDENGNVLNKKITSIGIVNVPLKVITSNDEKRVLLYQYTRKGSDSAFIQGTLFGLNGEIERQLAYSFRYDRERNIEPETFLDNAGNVHVLVYDKYNNYRLSTDLTLNSISFADEEIASETFTLQKIKLKTLRIFQNDRNNLLQVEGLYTDGMDKVTSGIYSISFPRIRRSELNTRFIPFSTEMIKTFKKGFSSTDATIRNSLQLHDMIYSDSGSFAVMRLSAEVMINPRSNLPERSRLYRSVVPFDMGNRESMVVSRAKNWNAPKLIFIKLEDKEGIEWQSIKTLDVFRRSDDMYNRFFMVGEKEKLSVILYQADSNDEPYPVFISMKNGKQVVEKFPEKELCFSPIQFLAHNQYGSLYLNTRTDEGGIMLIQENQ